MSSNVQSHVLGGGGPGVSPSHGGSSGWYEAAGAPGYAGQGGELPAAAAYAAEDDFANEPPLLEELGINFQNIMLKAKATMVPVATIDASVAGDADLAGPLIFALSLGVCLLGAGKMHFGAIYGVGICGCVGMSCLLALMSEKHVDFWGVCSVLGYGLLPILPLAALAIVADLTSTFGAALALAAALWSTYAVTRILVSWLDMPSQRFLIGYPVFALYVTFLLITLL